MTIEHITFDSTHKGQHLVVFGAVHGNEYCGPLAIENIIARLRNGELTLISGSVTFVPVCNPRAYEAKTRFIDRNLNRHFYRKTRTNTYEDTLDNTLIGLLDNADVFLDLHSYQSQGGPFAFIGDSSAREVAYARSLGLTHYIYGWAKAFSAHNATDEQKRAALGTTDYVRNKQSAGIAVTVECGYHDNEDAAAVGCDAILRAMAFAGLIDSSYQGMISDSQCCIQMTDVFYKEREGHLIKHWKHADFVARDTVIAAYNNGGEIVAPQDGYIVLPKASTDHAIGAEWFYFGVETAFPYSD